jgi:hypothetical protein
MDEREARENREAGRVPVSSTDRKEDEMGEASTLLDRMDEAMHYAGRDYLEPLSEPQLLSLRAYASESSYDQIVSIVDDELEHRRGA